MTELTLKREDITYWMFLGFILVGPALAIGQLKAYIVSAFFLIIIATLSTIRERRADKSKFISCTLFFASIIVWLVAHAIGTSLDGRYFTYIFYVIFCFIIFLLSFHMFLRLPRESTVTFIFTFCLLNLFLGLVEILMNFSLFGLNPVGDKFQIGAGFWANVNTNSYAVLIFSCAIYMFGGVKRYMFLTSILILYCILVHSKLVLILAATQLVFFILYSNPKYRAYGVILIMLISSLSFYFFQNIFFAVFFAVERAIEFFANDGVLKQIVESGRVDSTAIRAYAISEMSSKLLDFCWFDNIFGAGFGGINISFMNESINVYETYFSPHFFYIEIFIYGGALFYAVYAAVIRLISGSFAIFFFVVMSPTFAAVIAISSAVYFPPFYFLLAMVAYLAKSKKYSVSYEDISTR